MRLKYIDNAKAIAIILVVFAHTDGVPFHIENLIYSFNMPLFFFISGFLVKDSRLYTGIRYIGTQMQKTIVPYIFFGILSLMYYLFHNAFTGECLSTGSGVAGLIYGTCDKLIINRTLWFFTCLFTTAIAYFVLSRVFKKGQVVLLSLIIVCLFFLFYYKHNFIRLPWNIDLAAVALLFYSSGKYVSGNKITVIFGQKEHCIAKLILLFFLLLVIWFLSDLNGRIDMAFVIFKTPFLFMINAFLGILSVFLLASLLPETKMARYLSENTITIFPLHPLIFSVFTGIGIYVFKKPHSFQDNLLMTFLYTITAIALCYPVSVLITRYLPMAIGRRTKTE